MGCRFGCPAALPRVAAQRVFCGSDVAVSRWHLRRRVVRRDASHPRNRPAHGSRRAEVERAVAGDRTRDEAGADRSGRRRCGGNGTDAGYEEPALRGQADGPAHVRVCRHFVAWRSAARLLAAGTARNEGRSDRGAAMRLIFAMKMFAVHLALMSALATVTAAPATRPPPLRN